ncbi:MAG: hypothetical protein ABIT71_07895 [Vicinamibacteraceae bacterium]
MSVAVVAPAADPQERAHLRLCGMVTLETIACFAIPAIALMVGSVYSPIFFLAALADPESGWRPLALFVLGMAGFVGVGRLMHLLWNGPQPDARRWLTLSTIACGCGASLLHGATLWMGNAPGGVGVELPIVYLPLACTAHLVFLTRRSLFR